MSSDESESENEEIEVVPPPQSFAISDPITDLATHPNLSLIATADMAGSINVHKYESGEKTEQKCRFRVSKRTCRCVAFGEDGKDILTLSKLGSMKVTDAETLQVKFLNKGAHSAAPFCINVLSQHLVASGDDEGTFRVWDLRRKNEPILDEDRCSDYISDIAIDNNKRLLFVTSGEGTMTTYNIKKRKFLMQSENIENDMSSVAVVKNNTKVIAGTSEGNVLFYNWDQFAATSDKFPVHSSPVECIAPISERAVCVGSGDGKIRAVHLLPNRFIGVVGEHKNMSVDKIATSFDKLFIASSAHGKVVKFWSIGHLCHRSFDGKDKMARSLKHKKLRETGIGDDKSDFMNDIDNGLEPPEVAGSSEDEEDDETS